MSDDVKAEAAAQHVPTDREKVEQIVDAVREFHHALDLRQHGDVVAWQLVHQIELILDMPWTQGAEQAARAEKIRTGK